jgi:hypothetical protein
MSPPGTGLPFLSWHFAAGEDLRARQAGIGLPAGAAAGHTARIESILKHGLDQQPSTPEIESSIPDDHDNIRGPSYYH